MTSKETHLDQAAPKQLKVVNPSRKRASKACLNCRARKVRCDVVQKAGQCTNCSLDEEACVVTKRAAKFSLRRFQDRPDGSRSPARPASSPPRPQNVVSESTKADYGFANLHKPPFSGIVAEEDDWEGDVTYSYYKFVGVGNISRMSPQDINYLESQGCLRLPTRRTLDGLVRKYFTHVHPTLPVLDEGKFWDVYAGGSGAWEGRIPLLLLQAMIFTVCSYSSPAAVRALGFATSSSRARLALYRRAKLLYDFGTESSHIHLARAALLLSHCPEGYKREQQSDRAWLGAAIQNAQSAGAHRVWQRSCPAQDVRVRSDEQRAKRRIWICCVVRDRIMALTSRRSLLIPETYLDEGCRELVAADLSVEVSGSLVVSVGGKRRDGEVFLRLVDLCLVVTELVGLRYPDVRGKGCCYGQSSVEDVDAKLHKWYRSAVIKFPELESGAALASVVAAGSMGESVSPHSARLYLLYQSAKVYLYTTNLVPGPWQEACIARHSGPLSPPQSKDAAWSEVESALCDVLDYSTELDRSGNMCHLPTDALECLAIPWILQAVSTIKFPRGSNRQQKAPAKPSIRRASTQHGIHTAMERMRRALPQCDAHEFVHRIVEYVVQLDVQQPPPDWFSSADVGNGGPAMGSDDWFGVYRACPEYLSLVLRVLECALETGRLLNAMNLGTRIGGSSMDEQDMYQSPISGSGSSYHEFDFLKCKPSDQGQQQDQDQEHGIFLQSYADNTHTPISNGALITSRSDSEYGVIPFEGLPSLDLGIGPSEGLVGDDHPEQHEAWSDGLEIEDGFLIEALRDTSRAVGLGEGVSEETDIV